MEDFNFCPIFISKFCSLKDPYFHPMFKLLLNTLSKKSKNIRTHRFQLPQVRHLHPKEKSFESNKKYNVTSKSNEHRSKKDLSDEELKAIEQKQKEKTRRRGN